MKGNFCQEHTFWNKRPTDLFSGELYVEVEWSVLDTLSKEVVLTKTFNGYSKIPKPRRDGITRTFEQAFADTVEKLATDPQMVALAGSRDSNISQNDAQAGDDISAKPAGVIRIASGPRARSFASANVRQNTDNAGLRLNDLMAFFLQHLCPERADFFVVVDDQNSRQGLFSMNKARRFALLIAATTLIFPKAIAKQREFWRFF